jgi:hypothetical protein
MYPCTATNSEGTDSYEELRQNTIKIVSSRFAVPRGSKYIVIKDRIGIWRLLPASGFILLELLFMWRFDPAKYRLTFIIGGNLWYIFGRTAKWDVYSYDSKWTMYRILHWLHSKGLRYVVIEGSVGESTLRKAVDAFNQEQEFSAQIDIMTARNALRLI